jgi:hypothetical protein
MRDESRSFHNQYQEYIKILERPLYISCAVHWVENNPSARWLTSYRIGSSKSLQKYIPSKERRRQRCLVWKTGMVKSYTNKKSLEKEGVCLVHTQETGH